MKYDLRSIKKAQFVWLVLPTVEHQSMCNSHLIYDYRRLTFLLMCPSMVKMIVFVGEERPSYDVYS